MRILIDENMSKEVEMSRPAPGVVGRLMGLDTMPPLHVDKQQKEMGNFRRRSSPSYEEKHTTYDDHTIRKVNSEYQEFKDVFEVIEASKAEKRENQTVWKGMFGSKQGEIDAALTKNLTKAKSLSNDETAENFKDCNYRKKVLDRNKDIFLKFLQEPNPLFRKHLHDLKCAPPSHHASHVTISKSSKHCRNGSKEVWFTSGRNPERCTHIRGDVVTSYKKPAISNTCESPSEHSCLLNKLSESRYRGNEAVYHHPTAIVVLEASLRKEDTTKSFSLARSNANAKLGSKRCPEPLRSRTRELNLEGKAKHILSNNEVVMRRKAKSSRKITSELAEKARHTVSSSEKVTSSNFSGHRMDEISCTKSVMNDGKVCKEFNWTSDHFDECSNRSGTSSSVNRDGTKHLSERCRISRIYQEAGAVGRKSSTLAEMLALCDEDKHKMIDSPLVGQGFTKKEVVIDEELPIRICPSSIRSNDSWKKMCSTNLPTSTTLPVSSSSYENSASGRRNRFGCSNNFSLPKKVSHMDFNDPSDGKFSQTRSSSIREVKCRSDRTEMFSTKDQNILSEREIPVNPEKSRNTIYVGYLDAEQTKFFEPSDNVTSDTRHIAKFVSDTKNNVTRISSEANEELMKQSGTFTLLKNNGVSHGYNKKDEVIQKISIGDPGADTLSSWSDISESGSDFVYSPCNIPEPAPTVSPDKADRPSPRSVFEASSNQERVGKISAGLQDRRTQLQFLKLDPTDKYAVELDLISSDEEFSEERHSGLLQEFRDEEERDFSYLLDIIIESGVHGSEFDLLYNPRCSPECPIGAYVFDTLERKYCLLNSWSRKERKMLFDLINAILADNVVPFMDLHPWVNPKRRSGPKFVREGLVEEIWQMMVSRRKRSCHNLQEDLLEKRWLDLGNDIDLVGGKIERILMDDLLEEFVSQLIFM